MSDSGENEHEVEKIKKRKLEPNQQVLYLVKWKNYGNSANTWQPIESLDGCMETLYDFELSMAHKIIGVKNNGGVIEYLISQKDSLPSVSVPSAEACEKWPLMVLDFLESIVNFTPATKQVSFGVGAECGPGLPTHISYASNVTGQLVYLCEWPLVRTFVDSSVAKEKYSLAVLKFLEGQLVFDSSLTGFFIGQQIGKEILYKNIYNIK